MYKSEAAFSSALCKMLTAHGVWHQRIESAITGRGIPDLYIRKPAREWWVELKNIKTASVYDEVIVVPWRQGQQAWAQEYLRYSGGLCSYTIAALKDGYIVIPMTRVFKKNGVSMKTDLSFRCTKLNDLLEVFV